MPEVSDPMVQEWLTLLGLTTAYMTAAEAMIDGLQGKLGVDTREPDAREQAAHEINRRITAYAEARDALISYAREREGIL
jgi:hypothetical protein